MAPGVFGCTMSQEAYQKVQDYFFFCAEEKELSEIDRAFIETQSKVEDLNVAGLIHFQFHQVLTGSYGKWLVQEISRDPDTVDNQEAQEFVSAMGKCDQKASVENVEWVCKAFHAILKEAQEETGSPCAKHFSYSLPPAHAGQTPSVSRTLVFDTDSDSEQSDSSPDPQSPVWYSPEGCRSVKLEPGNLQPAARPLAPKLFPEENLPQTKSDSRMRSCVMVAVSICVVALIYQMINPNSS